MIDIGMVDAKKKIKEIDNILKTFSEPMNSWPNKVLVTSGATKAANSKSNEKSKTIIDDFLEKMSTLLSVSKDANRFAKTLEKLPAN